MIDAVPRDIIMDVKKREVAKRVAKGGRHAQADVLGTAEIVGARRCAPDRSGVLRACLARSGAGSGATWTSDGARRRGSVGLRPGGSECGRGGAPVRRRSARRSGAGRGVGGFRSRSRGEDRCRCWRLTPEAVAALAGSMPGGLISEVLVPQICVPLARDRVVNVRIAAAEDACEQLMDAGRVVEQGTHDELMAIEGGIYRDLVEAQSSGRDGTLAELCVPRCWLVLVARPCPHTHTIRTLCLQSDLGNQGQRCRPSRCKCVH